MIEEERPGAQERVADVGAEGGKGRKGREREGKGVERWKFAEGEVLTLHSHQQRRPK